MRFLNFNPPNDIKKYISNTCKIKLKGLLSERLVDYGRLLINSGLDCSMENYSNFVFFSRL